MYRDIDAVRQFEQQNARGHLPKMAGKPADEHDLDLMAAREGELPAVLSFIAVLALVAVVYLVADVVW